MKAREVLMVLTVSAVALSSCGPGATAMPPEPPTPDATVTPEPTPTPSASVGDWVDGHFWSIKVRDAWSETELDGEVPVEDVLVVVEVAYKAEGLSKKHRISGTDFELVDRDGERYDIAGMIMEDDKDESGEDVFQRGWWQVHDISSSGDDVFKLVYDLPDSAGGLRLWFQDLQPMIDLEPALSEPQAGAPADVGESDFDLESALATAITASEPVIHSDEDNIPVSVFASGARMTIASRLSFGNVVMLSDPTDKLKLQGTSDGTVRLSGKGAVVIDGETVYLFGVSLP